LEWALRSPLEMSPRTLGFVRTLRHHRFMRIFRGQRGQATAEYVVLITLLIAVLGAGALFAPAVAGSIRDAIQKAICTIPGSECATGGPGEGSSQGPGDDGGGSNSPQGEIDPGDADGDGIPDGLDPDDDNDGVPDTVDPDADTDGDGVDNEHDADDDGDGVEDTNDPDSDSDGDGITNADDSDDDGDGIPDSDDSDADSDADGIPDPQDSDDDGDGESDSSEEQAGTDPSDLDTDNDGLDDGEEAAAGTDPQNQDSDGDGIPDGEEVAIGSDPTAAEPSDDYESYQDPERRSAEHGLLYGDAESKTNEWQFEDPRDWEGVRLRLGLFIMDEETSMLGNELLGDDRGFDPQFSPNRTRAFIEIDFSTDTARVVVNPTCKPGRECTDARDIGDGSFGDRDNEVEFEQEDDGDLHFSWELNQSAYSPLGFGIPSIDGDFYVEFNDDGSITITMDDDGYPSYEIYMDDANGTTEIGTHEEGSPWDLWGP
jgi:hypothetical protein